MFLLEIGKIIGCEVNKNIVFWLVDFVIYLLWFKNNLKIM